MKQTRLLLLADERTARELAAQAGGDVFASCDDPYDALTEMGRQAWPTVVLTAPQGDFAELCRASRRLQKHCRLIALCPPAQEPEILPLRGEVLDDYFIYPPTRTELQSFLPAKPPAPPAAAVEVDPRLADPISTLLSLQDHIDLIEATKNLETLETEVAQIVRSRLGLPVGWFDENQAPAPGQPLLHAGGNSDRVLALLDGQAKLDPAQQRLIEAMGRILPPLFGSAARADSLFRMAVTDHLTGAYNRRYFFHLSDQILLRAQEKDCRVALLLYDMDNFKKYNDLYGHAAGDEILRETAALMKKIVRSQDIVARVGGDEFAVLFWDSQPPRSPDSRPPESAYVLANRFRQAVTSHQFPSLGPHATGVLTISGGLASFPRDGETCHELLQKADEALLEGKRHGKNAIHIIGPQQ